MVALGVEAAVPAPGPLVPARPGRPPPSAVVGTRGRLLAAPGRFPSALADDVAAETALVEVAPAPSPPFRVEVGGVAPAPARKPRPLVAVTPRILGRPLGPMVGRPLLSPARGPPVGVRRVGPGAVNARPDRRAFYGPQSTIRPPLLELEIATMRPIPTTPGETSPRRPPGTPVRPVPPPAVILVGKGVTADGVARQDVGTPGDAAKGPSDAAGLLATVVATDRP